MSDEHVTSHKLRAMYASLSYKMYADVDAVSLQHWISDVLGHDRGSMSTAASYSILTVKISKPGDEPPRETEDELAGIFINPNKRDGRLSEYLERSCSELEKSGFPVNKKNLASLGYGIGTINEFLKEI